MSYYWKDDNLYEEFDMGIPPAVVYGKGFVIKFGSDWHAYHRNYDGVQSFIGKFDHKSKAKAAVLAEAKEEFEKNVTDP